MNEVVSSIFRSIFKVLRIAGGIATLILTAFLIYIMVVMYMDGALLNAFSMLLSVLFTFVCSMYLLLGLR